MAEKQKADLPPVGQASGSLQVAIFVPIGTGLPLKITG
jgi:hypothetical protein